jgi:hypothetical protein
VAVPILLLRRRRRLALPTAPYVYLRRRGDSIALYLTGAATAGGTQPNPALSLGGYRSSTRTGGRSFLLSEAVRGITIDFVSGANGTGTGSLQAVDDDTLGWTPPGGERGDAVAIAKGETKLIEGGDPTQFVVVTRTSAGPLQGASGVELLPAFNNVFGQADGITGDVTYRAIVLKNGPATTVRNLLIWLGDVTNPTQIALDTSAAQPDGAFEVVGDENTGPSGVAFVAPDSAVHVDVLSVPKLKPNEQVAVWIERSLSAADATPKGRLGIRWSYTVAG